MSWGFITAKGDVHAAQARMAPSAMIDQLSPKSQAQAMDTRSTQSTPGSFLKGKL